MTTKEQYWKYSLIILILFTGLIIFREFAFLLSGILGASTIYILVRKQMIFFTEKKRLGRSVAASIILFEALLCFLTPISLVIWLLIDELHGVKLNMEEIIAFVQNLSDIIQQRINYNVLNTDNILTAVSYIPQIGQVLIGSVSGFVINALVMLFVLYFMLIGGRQMEAYLYDLLPFKNEYKKDVLKEVDMMVKSNAIGIPLLASIQGVIALIGYLIFDVPDPILFAFLTCFATIIPLIGTALIWTPLVAYLAFTGDWVNAIGLTVYALIVISNIDNLVRFILQKKIANTPPLITVFGVVVGLPLFGFWGVIFGPLLLSMFILCVNIFKKEYLDKE